MCPMEILFASSTFHMFTHRASRMAAIFMFFSFSKISKEWLDIGQRNFVHKIDMLAKYQPHHKTHDMWPWTWVKPGFNVIVNDPKTFSFNYSTRSEPSVTKLTLVIDLTKVLEQAKDGWPWPLFQGHISWVLYWGWYLANISILCTKFCWSMSRRSLDILEKLKNIKMAAMHDAWCVNMWNVELAIRISMGHIPAKYGVSTSSGSMS